ncbi:LOW QUALITY PROTEIN: hypothetical protein N665_0184s0002 [Sinapis alba]|nr:LOW QUALITY PROTEIN: hypothetical protein N665_0184s0002 [Sinapis alba]
MDVLEDQSHDYPPRLYAKGTYNLENKEINHMIALSEAIGHDVWDHLKEFPVGIVAKLDDSKFVWFGMTVHYLLCRHLRVYKKEIWSLIVDQLIRFSLHEFSEITGLNTYPLLTESIKPDQYKTFWEELNVLHGVRTKVFDDEAMRSYPWGLLEFFWGVEKNEKKNRTKAEVSSATEPPTKKQKKDKKHKEVADVEKKENADGKGATKDEGREDMGPNAVLRTILATLDNISNQFDNYDGRFEMFDSRFTAYDSDIGELSRNISNMDMRISDKVQAAVEEQLQVLGIGECYTGDYPPPISLPSPHNLPQKSVNSPPLTAYKTPIGKSLGMKKVLAEQVAKANTKGLWAKLNSEDEVAKATEVKKNLISEFYKTELDFVEVSPAKDQTYGCGCRVNQNRNKMRRPIRKQTADDSEVEDVTDAFVAVENELLP